MKLKKTETLADRLNFVKKLKGFTQTEISNLCGISHPTIASYFWGRRNPSDTTIIKLCEILNISPVWLRDGKGSHEEPFTKEKYLIDDFSMAYIDRDSTFEFKHMPEGRLMINCILSKKETEKLSKLFSKKA